MSAHRASDTTRFPWVCTLVIPSMLAAMIGCSGSPDSGRDLPGKIKGVVTYKGAPVKNAAISFVGSSQQGAFGGPLGEDGSYKVPEAAVGDFQIAILPINPQTTMTMTPGGKIAAPPERADIPKKYRDTKTSGLTLNVVDGDNEFSVDMVD